MIMWHSSSWSEGSLNPLNLTKVVHNVIPWDLRWSRHMVPQIASAGTLNGINIIIVIFFIIFSIVISIMVRRDALVNFGVRYWRLLHAPAPDEFQQHLICAVGGRVCSWGQSVMAEWIKTS